MASDYQMAGSAGNVRAETCLSAVWPAFAHAGLDLGK